MKLAAQLNEQQTAGGCFLPDFCNMRVTFAVVIAAQLLAVTLGIAGFTSFDSFWTKLSMQSLYIQWIALAANASLCLLKPFLNRLSAGLSGLAALLVLLLITALVAHFSYQLVVSESPGTDYSALMLQSLLISLIIGVLSLHYFYMQFRLSQQQQAESEAKFQALQARIRPHFLFNSMNTIAHLTRSDPVMAETVVENLADLFRATLEEPGRLTTLGQEIELAKGYLSIESMRLGGRLRVSWQLDEQLNNASMPSMMLQPLLENAVYHGIETSADGGEITITTALQQDLVSLTISNTINGSEQTLQRSGNRMAQENTRQRLLAVFAEQARFEIDSGDDFYRISMLFPQVQA